VSTPVKRVRAAAVFRDGKAGDEVELRGWVRTRRDSKQGFSFIELNDGSCLANLQIVVDSNVPGYLETIKDVTTGAGVAVVGEVKDSPGSRQRVEVHASALRVLGTADAQTYPLQKKQHSFEFLREIAHLRPRTNTFGAIGRVRNALCSAIHEFFQSRGFVYVHTPIITTSDCEGAGKLFQVTTLDVPNLPGLKQPVDFKQDFFAKPAWLTVSGQLEAEIFACSLGDCYTFGPTFRAENSNTPRHLAEFWMVEPEMPFYELQDNMDLAERFIRDITRVVLVQCPDDVQFFNERIDKTLLETLQNIIENDFVRLSYTDAIEILTKSGRQFEFPVEWGRDLQSEHERHLTEDHFKKPVIRAPSSRSICVATTMARPCVRWMYWFPALVRSLAAASARSDWMY
jgi:asparaginyl-tRNA synthetase